MYSAVICVGFEEMGLKLGIIQKSHLALLVKDDRSITELAVEPGYLQVQVHFEKECMCLRYHRQCFLALQALLSASRPIAQTIRLSLVY